jgi:phospholipase/carboxylesterase
MIYEERPADGTPEGLLILHHGRGADEHDLLGLADVLDPERRLHVVTPGGPLQLPGWPGRHWYVVPRVGYPDPGTFHASYAALARFHDETWERTGTTPETTVLGGFSMGSVMSYALGLGPNRPAPAGIMAFSGFIPTVDGWQPQVPRDTRVLIAHGRTDPVIGVQFAREAKARLADMDVTYLESDVAHQIDPRHLPVAADWL